MTEEITLSVYTIETDHWTGSMKKWEPHNQEWNTVLPREAIRKLAYFRFAYPASTFVLLKDGFIVSTEELADMAQLIILDY